MLNRAGQRGVTLIEFLIAFVILGILIAAGVPAFRDWIVNTQVRATADSVNDGLQQARSEAVRTNCLVAFVITSTAGGGWEVWRRSSGLDATVCTDTLVASRGQGEGSNSRVTGTGATVCFVGSGAQPAAAIGACPARNTFTLNIDHSTGGACQTVGGGGGPVRCLRVTVGAGGQVRMCDPAVASGAGPAACS